MYTHTKKNTNGEPKIKWIICVPLQTCRFKSNNSGFPATVYHCKINFKEMMNGWWLQDVSTHPIDIAQLETNWNRSPTVPGDQFSKHGGSTRAVWWPWQHCHHTNRFPPTSARAAAPVNCLLDLALRHTETDRGKYGSSDNSYDGSTEKVQ